MSPAFFATEYLKEVTAPDHQIEWYNKVLDQPTAILDYDRIGVFSSRDHGKSTALAYVLPLWRQACDHNLTQCFVGYKLDIPQLRLRRIKREVENNTRLREDFGLYPDKDAGWDSQKLFFQRTIEAFEPSIFCYGIASGGTAYHMDYMYWDDVVTTENSMSVTLRQRIAETVATSVYPQVKPGGQLLCVGTPKHVEDLYSTFADFDTETSRSPGWRCYFYPAYRDDGPPMLWKSRYPMSSLLGKKAQLIAEYGILGERMYIQEYLLKPHALGGEEFSDDWLRFYNPDSPHVNLNNYPHYIFTDPASGERDQSSYSATVVVAYAQRSDRYYIREIIRQRVGLPKLPNHISEVYTRWRHKTPYITYGIESGFWQTALIKLIDKAIPVKAVSPHAWGKTPGGKTLDKFDRIRLMGSFFGSGRVYLPDPTMYPMTSTFVNKEYRPFPQCSTFDMLDAMNGALHMIPQRTQRAPILRWE